MFINDSRKVTACIDKEAIVSEATSSPQVLMEE